MNKPTWSDAIQQNDEMWFKTDMRKRLYVELSKAGFSLDEIRVVRNIIRGTCMECLDGDRRCQCRSDF